MIIIKLIGGLGNQLFQYALGRRLAYDHNTALKLDLSWFQKQILRTYQLDGLNISADIASSEEIASMTHPRLSGWMGRMEQAFQQHRVVREKTLSFDPFIVQRTPRNAYLIGYWQSEKYFLDIANELRQELTYRSPPNRVNEDIMQLTLDTNSISLHVRRGDYISNPETSRILGFSGVDYYQKCIQMLASEVTDPHFFVFSDDMEWVKSNLTINYPVLYIDHNPVNHESEDFRIMKTCKHHIIANSSFSWWAAWLASYPQKRVLAPRRWFNDESIDSQDLVPASWIRI